MMTWRAALFSRSVLLFWILGFATGSHASVETGFAWLASQQQANGSFLSQDIAVPQQTTSEAITALTQQTTSPFNSAGAVASVALATDEDIETLVRKILIARGAGGSVQTALTSLLTYQNPDGGFGSYPGNDSTPLDTALALVAMPRNSVADNVISTALFYLTSQQKTDGSYLHTKSGDVSFYVTSMATIALGMHQLQYSLTTPLAKSTDYLLTHLSQQTNPLSEWEKALGILGIRTVYNDQTQYQFALNNLVTAQQSNGSWSDDAYVTALVLQALGSVTNPDPTGGGGDPGGGTGTGNPPPPVLSSIGGRIIDSETHQPITSVSIALSGQSAASFTTSATGQFTFSDLQAGSYTLTITSPGYGTRTLSTNLAASTSLSYGDVSLLRLPTQGIIKGFVRDATTGAALSSATLTFSGIISQSLITDANGFYQVSGDPGSFSVVVTKDGYLVVSASGALVAGAIGTFSPSLYPVTTPTEPPKEVSVSGYVIDNDTQTPLAGVSVVEQHSGASVTTGANGAFSFAGLTAGELTLVVGKTGYTSVTASFLAPEGSIIHVGNIYLSPDVLPPLTSLQGKIVDASSGQPIVGATVSLDGLSTSATTDASGAYQIQNIATNTFNVTITAVGYVELHAAINVQAPTVITADYTLHRATFTSVEITDFYPDRGFTYPAGDSPEFTIKILNSSNKTEKVALFVKILDASGNVYDTIDVREVPLHVDPETAFIILAPGAAAEEEVHWHIGGTPAGSYQLIAQAFNHSTALLSERAITLNVTQTQKIGGSISFSPPVMQLAANNPVSIQAKVSNRGNTFLEEGSVTATLSLKTKGTTLQNNFDVSVANSSDFTGAKLGGTDNAGNLYVAETVTKVLKKMTSTGTVQTIATNLPTSVIGLIVDIDRSGKFYLLTSSNYYTLTTAGVLTKFNVGSHFSLSSFTLTQDGRLFIAGQAEVFEVKADGSTPVLVGAGLAGASGMVIGSDGTVYISDESANAIWQYKNGVISAYITGLSKPSAIVMDGRGYIYVTLFGSNSLVEISPNKVQRVVSNQLSGPKDLKILSSGNYVVANYNSSEIVKVTDSGVITRMFGPTLNVPLASGSRTDGSVVIANNDGTLIAVAPDLTVTNIANGIINAVDLYANADGSTVVLHQSGQKLSKVSTSGVIQTILSSNNQYSAAIPDASGGSLVALPGSGIFSISSSGVSSAYLENYYDTAKRINRDTAGNLYLFTADKAVIKIDPVNEAVEFKTRNIGFAARQDSGFIVADDGSIYLSDYSGKKIVKLNTDNTVTTVASLAFNPGVIVFGPGSSLLVSKSGTKEIYQLIGSTATLYKTLVGDNVFNGLQFNQTTGELWASGLQKVVHVTSGGAEVVISPPGSTINDLTLLADGSVVVSATGNLSRISSTNAVTNLVDPALLVTQTMEGVQVDSTGNFWALRSSGMLFKFNSAGILLKKFSSTSLLDSMTKGIDGNIYVVDNGNVLRIHGSGKLADWIIYSASLKKLEAETVNSLLITSNTAVMRLDLTAVTLTNVITGFSSLSSLSVLSGKFAVLDQSLNKYEEFNFAGSSLRRFSGLVQPTAVAVDSSGNVYVGNSLHSALLKLNSTGQLEEVSGFSAITNLHFMPSGNLQISSGQNEIAELSASGQKTITASLTHAQEALMQNDGSLLLLSTEQLFSETGGGRVTLASGFVGITALASDSHSNLFATDSGRQALMAINADGSLRLMETLASPQGLAIEPSQDIFMVTYSTNLMLIFDQHGGRLVYQTAVAGVTTIRDRVWVDPGTAYWLTDLTIYRTHVQLNGNVGLKSGDAVYSVTRPLPGLAADSLPISIDLGQWQPTEDGDYLLELKSNTSGVEGSLMNTLHVGPQARSEFSLGSNDVMPGNSAVNSNLTIVGAASNTLTRIDTDQTTQIARLSGAGPVVADSLGNLYSYVQGAIYKATPAGVISVFAPAWTINGYVIGMTIDNANRIYGGDVYNNHAVGRFDTNGNYQIISTFTGIVQNITSDFNGRIFVAVTEGSSTRFYEVKPDGSTVALPILGISGVSAFTFTPDGVLYVLSGGYGGSSIKRVSADGKTVSVIHEGAEIENEGFSFISDCMSNIIFAPMMQEPFKPKFTEEDMLFQIMRDTGDLSVLLYGPDYDPTLADMDNLFYDRFANRLIVATDAGKIFSFPVICGGIDVQVHATTRSDVVLNSIDPAPSATINNVDGTKELIWTLNNVDVKGFAIKGNWLFTGLSEGETRPVVSDAYMQFNNSFDVANPIKVPITIPSVTASAKTAVVTTTDKTSYGSNENVHIMANVTNNNTQSFYGTVDISILTEAGGVIATLPPISISQLASGSNMDVTADWNTAQNFIGSYVVQAILHSSNGVTVATGSSSFAIELDATVNTVVESHIASEKLVYASNGIVVLNGTVRNASSNDIVQETIALITVTAPDNSVVFSQESSLNSLYPNGIEKLVGSLVLSQPPLGEYTVLLTVRDALNNSVLSTSTYHFMVEQSGAGGSGLSGKVSVNLAQAIKGQDVICTETISNQSVSDYTALPFRQLLMDMDNNVEINQLSFTLDMAAGAQQQISHTISTLGLNPLSYACVLQAQINGVWETLSGAGFAVVLPPLNLAATLQTNKTQYETTDTVQLSFSVSNLSAWATQYPVQAVIKLTASDGTVVYSTTVAVPAINSQASYNDQLSVILSDVLMGTYTASITLINTATLQTVTTQSLPLAVVDAPLKHLSGSVAASVAQVNRGDSMSCTYIVANSSQVSAATAAIEQRLVQMASSGAVTVDSTTNVLTLLPVQQNVTARPIDSHTLEVGNYVCEQYATVNAETVRIGQAPFKVMPAPLNLSASVSTDKQEYQADDTVLLSYTITNLSDLATEQTATLNVQVKDPNGVVVSTQNVTLAQLAALATQSNQVSVTLTHAIAGIYSIALNVLDATQQTVASSNATFTVVDDPLKHLSGTVSSSAIQIKKGEALSCTYKLVNDSTTSTITETIERRLLLIDAQLPGGFTVITSTSTAKTLVPSVTDTSVENVDTLNLAEGQYRCEQYTQVNHESINLGSAEFKVVNANTNLDVSYQLGEHGRLLLLLDATAKTDGKETWLRSLLDSEQWSYTIVYTADTFASQLATGQYMGYGLLANGVSLSLQTQHALAADVNSGKGLVVSSNISSCDNTLEAVLGIRVQHDHIQTVSAIIVAVMPEHDDDEEEQEQQAAVTANQYGLGVAMFIDPAAPADSYAIWLTDSFAQTQPEPMPISAPNAVPVNITVENKGIATQVRLRLSDTSNAHVVAGDGWTQVQDAGHSYWQYSGTLAENGTLTSTVYIQLLNNSAVTMPLTVDTSLDGSQWALFRQTEITIAPAQSPAPPVQPVIEDNACGCEGDDTHDHGHGAEHGQGHDEHGSGNGYGHCKDHEDHKKEEHHGKH